MSADEKKSPLIHSDEDESEEPDLGRDENGKVLVAEEMADFIVDDDDEEEVTPESEDDESEASHKKKKSKKKADSDDDDDDESGSSSDDSSASDSDTASSSSSDDEDEVKERPKKKAKTEHKASSATVAVPTDKKKGKRVVDLNAEGIDQSNVLPEGSRRRRKATRRYRHPDYHKLMFKDVPVEEIDAVFDDKDPYFKQRFVDDGLRDDDEDDEGDPYENAQVQEEDEEAASADDEKGDADGEDEEDCLHKRKRLTFESDDEDQEDVDVNDDDDDEIKAEAVAGKSDTVLELASFGAPAVGSDTAQALPIIMVQISTVPATATGGAAATVVTVEEEKKKVPFDIVSARIKSSGNPTTTAVLAMITAKPKMEDAPSIPIEPVEQPQMMLSDGSEL